MATEEVEVAHSAHVVAAAFVEQYYKLHEQMPDAARKFYVDASVITRPSPDGSMLSFTSVEAIDEQILSWDYKGTTFDLLSVDAQYSLEDGIFIMVIGFFTGKDNIKRKFSQMFYLARQKKSYVVLNDIFRFVDDEPEPSVPPTPPVVESVPATEMVKPAVELNNTDNVTAVEKSVNAAQVKSGVAEATPSLENGKIKPSDEKPVAAQKPKEPVASQPDGAKKTFASIVQAMANNAAPIQVKTPIQKPKHMGQPRAAAVAPVSNSEKKNVQRIIEEPGTSIFVSNLPMNAVAPQLKELFKDFGPFKEDGIQVRSSKAKGTCYGFIAFESPASVQSLLEAAKNNPFVLLERKLSLKEKKVDYGGSKPSGGRSGGGSRTQNGSADGGDEFRRNKNRRNGGRNERRGERNANGDNNQKNNEGGVPEVKA